MNKLYFYLPAILLFYNINLFSQNPPPWDFNGVDHGFVAQNYASLTIGDTYVTFTLNDSDGDGNAESANSNFKNTDAGIDTSLGGFIAITMKNETANNKMQAILGPPSGTCGCFVNFETLSANDSDFVTHYINVGANSIWTGTLSEITFRFKKGNGINNETFAGDILIDHIEIVDAIPATPRVDYTFDDTTDSEGFSGANGVTVTQPVAGELNLDIAAQSPYPKLEQTGLYSVDADMYKYVLVTLVNNSPKNKLTLVSPSGGNEYSAVDMVANDGVVQTYELDLTNLTNWNGTQANWWLQLVENSGDGVVASAGIIDIQQILFSEESTQEPVVTFPICEDFEEGSEFWTFLDLGGLESGWTLDTANGPSGQTLDHYYLPANLSYNDWAISPSYDTSSLSDATVSYYEECVFCADSDGHNVYYSLDFAGDVETATWVALYEGVNTDAEDVGAADLGVQSTYSIPSAVSVVIAFNYVATYGAEWNIDDVCIDGTLSTSDNEILDMIIYPNPVDNGFITILSPVQGLKEIQVFTIDGRKVMDTTINGNTLDVSSFNSGFYMLKVTIDGQSKVSKLVVR